MTIQSQTVVELEGVNGEWFNLTTGDRGVYLATDVKGAFFDPPVKAVYEEPGNYPGARYLNHRILRRDIVFGVEILNDGPTSPRSWMSRDSEWRKAWAYDRDCKLFVTTPDSGTRYLKVRMLESPEVDMFMDPQMRSVNRTVMTCVAQDPFWYEDDAVYSAVTQEDTSFDPNELHLPWPFPQQELPTERVVIEVDACDCRGGLNPTDQYIFPKWTIPGSSFPPAEPYVPGVPWLGAPKSRQTIWTVPDYSFEDPEFANRRVRMPGLIGGLRTDEVQNFNLDGIVESGTFTLTHNGETTGPLPWDATPGQVKAALEALAGVAYDDVDVARGPYTREVQIVRLKNATGGTFTLSFGGQTTQPINFNATDSEVAAKLVQLPAVGLFDVVVQSKVTNEVQVVQLVGEPTDGTFTLTFDGHTTAPIPHNANTQRVKAELAMLPNINLADIEVTREWFKPYAPYNVRFTGAFSQYKGVDVPLLSGNADGLEGGAAMDVVVKAETEGSRPYTIKFGGARTGQNVPELVIDGSLLTKEDPAGPAIETSVITDIPGSHPYVVKFRNGCSGVSYPLLVVNTGNLTGFGEIGYRCWKTVEGRTAPAENCVIDVDPRNEQVVSESGSSLWSRMNGVRFRHPIPPYTESARFELDVSGCVPGQMVTLRLPRPWSRPWGLD